jgi:hypothetical protein
MKDISTDLTNEVDDGASLFTSVMELEQVYGTPAILNVLQVMMQNDSEDTEYCNAYREEAAFLALELSQLLIKYNRRNQPPLPAVNSPGSGLLQ